MAKKKKFAGIAAVSLIAISLCIGTTIAYASNNDGLKKNVDSKAKTQKEQTYKAVEKVQTHDDLAAIAAKLGINTAGMSDEQIQAALVAYKLSHQDNTKSEGLPSHNELAATAAKLGINTDGMSDEQIEAALISYKLSHQYEAVKTEDLQAIAKKMDINTAGMAEDQIRDAIKEKAK